MKIRAFFTQLVAAFIAIICRIDPSDICRMASQNSETKDSNPNQVFHYYNDFSDGIGDFNFGPERYDYDHIEVLMLINNNDSAIKRPTATKCYFVQHPHRYYYHSYHKEVKNAHHTSGKARSSLNSRSGFKSTIYTKAPSPSGLFSCHQKRPH